MFNFIKSVLSENGEGSYSRTSSMLIVLATLAWVSYIVFHTKGIPDLTSAVTFMCIGTGSQYGVNQLKAMIKGKGE